MSGAYTSGWCETGHCPRCPLVLRAATERRSEIRCSCGCHRMMVSSDDRPKFPHHVTPEDQAVVSALFQRARDVGALRAPDDPTLIEEIVAILRPWFEKKCREEASRAKGDR